MTRTSSLSLLLGAVVALSAVPAQASVGQRILEKCAHGQPFSGYTQKDYREALKDMSTTTREYSQCESEIRQAELAALGGNKASEGNAASRAALPLTSAERTAVQSAHKHGASPVRVGSEPIQPGVVHANIASAVNTLPHSLFAVIALLIVAALTLAAWEVRERVRSRRDD